MVHNEVACCWWLCKGLSRVFKGQTGFEVWVVRFRVLGASFSIFGCFVFEIWMLGFQDLGASCFRLCFRVLRFRNCPFLVLMGLSILSIDKLTSLEKVVMLQFVIPEISQDCSGQYDWIRGYASSPRSMFPNILWISEWLFSQNSWGFESYNLERQWIFWSCSPFFPNHLLFCLSRRHTSASYFLTYMIISPPSSIFDFSINTYIFFLISSLFFCLMVRWFWINFRELIFFVKKIIQWNPVNMVTNGPRKIWRY